MESMQILALDRLPSRSTNRRATSRSTWEPSRTCSRSLLNPNNNNNKLPYQVTTHRRENRKC